MAKQTKAMAAAQQEITALTVRGIVAILFGLVALFWPGLTLVTLVYVFSAYLIVSGLIGFIMSLVTIRDNRYWLMDMLLSALELGIGVYLIRNIKVTLATFILLVGISFVVRGVVDMVRAFVDSAAQGHRILVGLGGLVSLVAGLVVLRQPVSGGIAFVWVLGLYALISGPLMIALASEARREIEA
jgi:uncharacterized membrane protein HdeD (DUF308 family)